MSIAFGQSGHAKGSGGDSDSGQGTDERVQTVILASTTHPILQPGLTAHMVPGRFRPSAAWFLLAWGGSSGGYSLLG